jgi:protease-4
VNSPGGSAFASDLIWRKIKELKGKKPVIVSMSDVAASGGYYISMAASKIIAQPGTLTGSIGVVGGKADLSGGYQKLGITKTSVSRGAFAGLFSETSGFAPQEREIVERMMRTTYDDFVGKAAEGRKMPREKMDQVAQGKVWMGSRAKEVGLVDEIGGLPQAIDECKTLIGLEKTDKVELVVYPKELTLVDLFEKALGGSGAQVNLGNPGLDALLPGPLKSVLGHARVVLRLMEREKVVAVMPFVPVIQ